MTTRSSGSCQSQATSVSTPSKTRTLALLGVASLAAATSAHSAVVNVPGNLSASFTEATHSLNFIVGAGNSGVLQGDFITHWSGSQGSFSVPVDTNGHLLHLSTGDGNSGHVASGVISGTGSISVESSPRWRAVWNVPYTIGGTASNTYTGTTTIPKGNVVLNKTSGSDALLGTITVGSPGDTARVVWGNYNQISDTSAINILLPAVTDPNTPDAGMNFLDLAGFSDTIASLTLADAGTKTQIRTGAGGILTVGSLTVNGVGMAQGIYTSTSGFVTGTGSVVVGSGPVTPPEGVVNISNATTPAEPASPGAGVDINSAVGAGNTGRLVGLTQTIWWSLGFSVPVDLNGNTLVVDSGNGNTCIAAGKISGNGIVKFDGGGNLPVRVTGNSGNTYTGTTELVEGVLSLEKATGNALLGTVKVTNGGIVWEADHQIDNASPITLVNNRTYLNFSGHSEDLGTLAVSGDSNILLGSGSSIIHFSDSSAITWAAGKQLVIREWNGTTTGGGAEGVFFGSSASGLSASQIASVGFMNPAGFPAGLYRAQILASGEVVPTGSAVVPASPPYDLSVAAAAARAASYTSTGRADLTAAETPLEAGTRIVFFGDSITWLNGYISKIETAIASGAGTTGQGISLINRGINGGGAIQVRDGSPDAGYPGTSVQASFSSLLTSDQADIAVVFIGINDVWWRETTPANYEQTLRDLAATAAAKGVKLIFATPSAHNESPIGADSLDPAIDQFSNIVRTVASDTGSTFVDLRTTFVNYWRNNNYEIRLDGTFITLQTYGLLTYDGVHPTNLGNEIIADQLSAGILASLGEVVEGPAFATWAATKGLTGASAAFLADPDGDGIANGIEFVIGGEPNPANPGSNSSALMPTVSAAGTDLVFTFTRMHAAAALNPSVVFSTNLQGPWTTAAASGATVNVTTGTLSDTVVVTLPKAGGTHIFARLAVTHP